jgi:hypothetical protein
MTGLQGGRHHGQLSSSPLQQVKLDDEDSHSTIYDSEELENNPVSEYNRHAVRCALVGDTANETTCRSRGDDPVRFSIDEVKTMVLQAIPGKVRGTMTTESWDRIFDEAAATVLSDHIDDIGDNTTAEDIKDIITFISVFVQREARGHLQSEDEVRERSEPSSSVLNPPGMDAVSLALKLKDEEQDMDHDNDSYDERRSYRGQETLSPEPVVTRKVSPSPPRYSPLPPRTVTTLCSSDDGDMTFKLTFTEVEIRYYEQILVDHPAVSSGPPIGIGWRYRIMNKEMTVDAWEERRQNNRRYLTGLMTSRHERTSRLYDLGYSKSDLARCIREVMRVKNSRKKTFHNLRFENMEEIMERIIKKVKNVLSLGTIKRKEKKLLHPYISLNEN